jgi:hypothetical protein
MGVKKSLAIAQLLHDVLPEEPPDHGDQHDDEDIGGDDEPAT